MCERIGGKIKMKFNSVGQNDYLVYNDLQGGQLVNSICYVVDYSRAVSAIETNYYRLVVRTVDGKQMICTIFDTDDFDKLGFRLNHIVNKYVRLEAKVQEFNDRYSLRFISLNVIETPTPDLVQKFQRTVDGLDYFYNDVNEIYQSIFGKPFPLILKKISYPSIYDGCLGGFVKLTWEMMIQCQSVSDGLGYDEFIEVMFSSLIHYSTFLQKAHDRNLITDSDKIEFVSNIPNNDFKGRLTRETTSSLIGLCKANHIVSVLIDKTFRDLIMIHDLKSCWDMMKVGGVSQCQGIELLKY